MKSLAKFFILLMCVICSVQTFAEAECLPVDSMKQTMLTNTDKWNEQAFAAYGFTLYKGKFHVVLTGLYESEFAALKKGKKLMQAVEEIEIAEDGLCFYLFDEMRGLFVASAALENLPNLKMFITNR